MEICQSIDYDVEDARYVSPCDIGGLALWLDATDGPTLIDKDGDVCAGVNGEAIDIWLDKSGNELNGKARTISSSDAFRPKLETNFFNKKNAIKFNQFAGQGFFGDYPFAGYDATSFVVLSAGEIGFGFGKVFSFDSLLKGSDLVSRDHIIAYDYQSNSVTAYGAQEEFPFYSQGRSLFVTSVSWTNRLENSVFINGESRAVLFIAGPLPLTGDIGKYSVGCESVRSNTLLGTAHFNGYIGEVISYKRILSDAERQYIEKYLLFKWGFSS